LKIRELVLHFSFFIIHSPIVNYANAECTDKIDDAMPIC
jgi:hypothetical protein